MMGDGSLATNTKKSAAFLAKSVGWRDMLGFCAHSCRQQDRLMGLILVVILVEILIYPTILMASGLLDDRGNAALNEQAEFGPAYQSLFLLSGTTIRLRLQMTTEGAFL